jgi:hypothetical protein
MNVCNSQFLFTADTLDLKAWRQHVPGIPIYAAIQPETKPSASETRCEFCLGEGGYRKSARERWADGADGVLSFQFLHAARMEGADGTALSGAGPPGRAKLWRPLA